MPRRAGRKTPHARRAPVWGGSWKGWDRGRTASESWGTARALSVSGGESPRSIRQLMSEWDCCRCSSRGSESHDPARSLYGTSGWNAGRRLNKMKAILQAIYIKYKPIRAMARLWQPNPRGEIVPGTHVHCLPIAVDNQEAFDRGSTLTPRHCAYKVHYWGKPSLRGLPPTSDRCCPPGVFHQLLHNNNPTP